MQPVGVFSPRYGLFVDSWAVLGGRGDPSFGKRGYLAMIMPPRRGGEIGKHRGLKIPREQSLAGSNPAPGIDFEAFWILRALNPRRRSAGHSTSSCGLSFALFGAYRASHQIPPPALFQKSQYLQAGGAVALFRLCRSTGS